MTVVVADTACLPLAAGNVDVIVTSPPYNVGVVYDASSDTLTADEYVACARRWSAEMWRVLRPDRRCWVNVAPSVTIDDHDRPGGNHSGRTKAPRLPLLHVWQSALAAAGFTLIDVVAWHRIGNNSTAWGSWQSPTAPNLRGNWEAIIVACKGGWARETPPGRRDEKDTDGSWQAMCSTVWTFPPAARNGSHPAPFPPELARRCIRLSTWPGELVFDPFAGSGTTLRVTEQLRRRAVGTDLSLRYCRYACAAGVQHAFDFGGLSS